MRETTATLAFVGLLLILTLMQITFAHQWEAAGLWPAQPSAIQVPVSVQSPSVAPQDRDGLSPYERLKRYKREAGDRP